jgi:hypothetical protein
MGLAEIINVQITRETRAVTSQGFGTPLIFGSNANFNARLQYFEDLASIADALAGGTLAPEYIAASDMFAQNPRVTRLAIGQQRGTKTLTDNAGTYTAGSAEVTVNGTLLTQAYSVDKNTTLTALAAQIQAHADVATAVYNSGAHTIVITPDTGKLLSIEGDLSGITGLMEWTLSATATETITDALNAIQQADDDWYGLMLVSRTQQDQLDAADWIEGNMKVFCVASSEADIVNVTDALDSTSLAALLKIAGYTRTFGVYSALADTEYPDAALLGKLFPYDPGTYTAKFKSLASITAGTLTTTQSTNARDKNFNTFETIGGVSIIREGKVSEGEFIDVIIFADWLDSNITTDVYSLLVNQRKVPYTEAGIAGIKSVVEKRLQIGLNRGGISPFSEDSDKNQNGGYIVTVPAFEDIPQVDKIARQLNDVRFTAWLAGAIHAIRIDGVITV